MELTADNEVSVIYLSHMEMVVGRIEECSV